MIEIVGRGRFLRYWAVFLFPRRKSISMVVSRRTCIIYISESFPVFSIPVPISLNFSYLFCLSTYQKQQVSSSRFFYVLPGLFSQLVQSLLCFCQIWLFLCVFWR